MGQQHHVQTELDANGYAVAHQAAIAAICDRSPFERPAPWAAAGAFRSSARDAPVEARMAIDRAAKEILGPVVDALFGRQRHLIGGLLAKGPGAPALPFHQDLTYTDESRHRSYTAWVPLLDVGRHDGALRVVAGSHLWQSGIRPAGPGGRTIERGDQRVLLLHCDTVQANAGDVVIWDNAVIHGSAPNRGSNHRTALAVTFTSTEATAAFFYRDLEGDLEGYELDDDHLTEDDPFLSRPRRQPTVRPWGPQAPAPTVPDDWTAEHRAEQSGRAR